MKKSLLALLVSSVFLLSACNEKETQALNEKLQQAEQTISQLNQDLAKSQQDLTALQEEQSKLQAQMPALEVEIVPFFSKSEPVKSTANTEQDRESSDLYYFTSIAKTHYDWLDNLLIRNTLLKVEGKINNQITGTEKDEALKSLEKAYEEAKTELTEMGGMGMSDVSQMVYSGQRGNIATFTQYWDNYTGGAHGMYGTNYLNVDLTKKTVISLDSLMSKAHQDQAKALLWKVYLEKTRMEAQDEKAEPFTSKADFDLVDNFYFADNGIHFVYPPYALGPYAEGEITLVLSWDEANKLVSNEYQRTKKDGVGLAPENNLQ
nr:DUF3298 domain-containing protein [uncultured Haemophilus sp.]